MNELFDFSADHGVISSAEWAEYESAKWAEVDNLDAPNLNPDSCRLPPRRARATRTRRTRKTAAPKSADAPPEPNFEEHTRETRRAAHEDSKKFIERLARRLCTWIETHPPTTTEGMALGFGGGPNQQSIGPARLRLAQARLIEVVGRAKNRSGRPATVWRRTDVPWPVPFPTKRTHLGMIIPKGLSGRALDVALVRAAVAHVYRRGVMPAGVESLLRELEASCKPEGDR
jgi:hypothetical protein